MNNVFTVFGDQYDQQFFESKGKEFAEVLSDLGILMFPEFINNEALKRLEQEAEGLKSKAFESSSSYNVYVKPFDPEFSKDSARNRLFGTTKKCIPNDLLPLDSVLQTVYDAPLLQQFFAQIIGVESLYPYSDDLSSINVNYYDEGDSLEWHFDNSDFTITLLVKACEEGGIYEYCTDMRYDDQGNENYGLVEKILDGLVEPNRESVLSGDLMIFKGNKSLHRVTPVVKGERILVTFNFNTEPGISLSKESRKTFFGRTE